MRDEIILEMQNISYAYDKGFDALKDVSVSVKAGERIALLGNNGAGKSTFFLCCNGVLKPTAGKIILGGQELSRSKKDLMKLRESVGLVFQDPDDQIIASTVEAEVSFGPMNLGYGREEVERRVDGALADMDLLEYRERVPQYLSGGEKKRVSIADILAMEPKLILFDEPTSSLDPENTRRLGGILTGLSQRGMTLIVATHDIDFAYAWADRILVLCGGELLADDVPAAIFADDETIEKANLTKPILYETAQTLCQTRGVTPPKYLPRTTSELPAFLKEIAY